MLWPHYLRTIPWLSVVALTPELPTMKMAETVPAGLEIYSRPLGPKNTVCCAACESVGRVRYRLSTRIGWTTRRGGYDFAHTGIVAQLGSPQMLDFYDNSVLPGLQ